MSSEKDQPDSESDDIDERLEALAERVANLEEDTGLSTTAPDGSRVSFEQLLALGLTRRQAIAALGFVAAGATITAAISRSLGTVQAGEGDDGVVHLDIESLSIEEANINGRPITSFEHERFYIPGDYDSVQAAIDETLPFNLKHEYRYVVDKDHEEGHLTIPGFISDVRFGNENDPDSEMPANGRIRIFGPRNEDRPVSDVRSVYISGAGAGPGSAHIEAFNITGKVPEYRRNVGILVHGTTGISLSNLSFEHNDEADNALEPYSANIHVRNTNWGNDKLERAIRMKRGQFVSVSNCFGSVTHTAYEPEHGHIRLSGDETVAGERYVNIEGGVVVDEENDIMYTQRGVGDPVLWWPDDERYYRILMGGDDPDEDYLQTWEISSQNPDGSIDSILEVEAAGTGRKEVNIREGLLRLRGNLIDTIGELSFDEGGRIYVDDGEVYVENADGANTQLT